MQKYVVKYVSIVSYKNHTRLSNCLLHINKMFVLDSNYSVEL